MSFNLKQAPIYQAIVWGRHPGFKFSKPLSSFFLDLFFILISLFLLARFVFPSYLGSYSLLFLGSAILSLSIGLLFLEIYLFFKLRLANPEIRHSINEIILSPEDYNFAYFLNYEAARICFNALKYIKRSKDPVLVKDALLYSLLKSKTGEINFVFSRTGISYGEFYKKLKENIIKKMQTYGGREKGIETFEEIMLEAMRIAQAKKRNIITPGDILLVFSKKHEVFKEFLILEDLKEEDLENLVDWYEQVKHDFEESRKFWKYKNLLKNGLIGEDWASGYTITLDKYSQDLRKMARFFGARKRSIYDEEIKEIERILEQEDINDVLLIGDSDFNKSSILQRLAQDSFLGDSVEAINYKRILDINLSVLISETSSQEELELVLNKCLNEAVSAGNVILVIENIHDFVGETTKIGAADISGILSSYIGQPGFSLIATTDHQGLHKIIERKSSMAKLFNKVEIHELAVQETMTIMENRIPYLERKHKIFIGYKAMREIVELASKYISVEPFPEKALKILDESMTYVSVYTKDKILLPKHIRKVVSQKVDVPLQKMGGEEKEVLLNLESLIHQRIINQEEAVKDVSAALRRARADIKIKSGPIGSFLFLGPTGVGKTETSKALAQVYFGSEDKMVRLDMSEFQNIEDLKRLIGSEEETGLLTTPIKDHPFSLVLLDELEKAHPNILNLFLQILDEGHVTDGMGVKVNFKNTIIIATSNAGAEIIREDIEKNKKLDILKEELLDYLLRQKIFRPEFVNRFDAVVAFKPLTKQNLLSIAELILKKLAKNLEDKGIKFEITEELKEKIVELGYSPTFGAREMKRVVQDNVENVLANALLSDKIKRGNIIKVEPKDFSLVIVN